MKIGILAVFIVLIAFLSSGCVSGNLLSEKGFKKNVVSNSHVYFMQTWALEENGKFIVKGRIRKKTSAGAVPKFVKVELIDSGGTVLGSRKVAYFPRIMSRRGQRNTARFTANFDTIPAVGTTIRLALVE